MGHNRIVLGSTAGIAASVATVGVVALVRRRGHGMPSRRLRQDWSSYWAQASTHTPALPPEPALDQVEWATSVAAGWQARLPRTSLRRGQP